MTSSLGDFGLGPVTKAYTLWPGEEMKISTKTWTSTGTERAEASSTVDSFSQTAAAIVHQPTLLFVHEPTANLDPILRRKF